MIPLPRATADVAFVGGTVVTMDSSSSVAEALSVAGSRILAVGTREEVLATADSGTEVIDLGGGSLIPGFVDNHVHMANAWQRRWEDVSFPRCRTVGDVVEVMAGAAAHAPVDSWVVGRGFEPLRLEEGRSPNRHDLDRLIPDHRVGICNREGMGWTFNTAGLRAIGVNDDTPDPPGGPLERDEAGLPLGPMWDNARTFFIVPNMPRPTDEDLVQGYAWIEKELLRLGVTTAHEAGYKEARHVQCWSLLAQRQRAGLRVVLGPYPLVGSTWDAESAPGKVFASGLPSGFGNDFLKLGALQMGVDGGLIGHTAALFAPYSNRTDDYRGSFRVTEEVLTDHVRQASEQGWQAGLICQGDAGIERSLKAIRGAGGDIRHRLEHAYLWSPPLMDLAAELGVIWNTQAALLPISGYSLQSLFGDRSRFAFPFRSMIERGVTISGGSDWPVGPLNPIVGIDALVNHTSGPDDGAKAFNEEERVSVMDAFRIYTSGGAAAGLESSTKGSLEPSKLADLVVLNRDITRLQPQDVRKVRVRRTYVDGLCRSAEDDAAAPV